MAKMKWGKPKVEFCKLEDGALPLEPQWKEIKPIKEGTTNLNVEEGEKVEAKEEGGALVDMRISKNKYSLELEMYQLKGGEKPIEDNDGVILDNYAVRLTPEDATNKGFMMPCCQVSVIDTFTSADGATWKYTFTGLQPEDGGKIFQEYIQE